MRATLTVAALLLLSSLTAGACASHKGHHDDGASAGAHGCQACAKGAAGENAWCDSCGVGFVGGKQVACKGCFTAMTGGPACPSCSKQ